MNPKIHIDEGTINQGVFASAPIHVGEVIFFVTGELLTFSQVMALPGEGDRTIQIGENAYVNPGYPAEFINHSCDPNAGIRDDLAIVAIRPIVTGEEVRFDYSTCVLERSFRMKCLCGAATCRGEVGDFDELPEDLQKKYIVMGVVQPFIMDHYFGRRRQLSAFEKEFQASSRLPPRKDLPPPNGLPAVSGRETIGALDR